MIKKAITFLSLAAWIALLTGCGNQAFDCPHTDGVRCMRLSEVDRQITAGKLGADHLSLHTVQKATPLVPLAPSFFVPEGSLLRSQEEVLSIWMAPYQSEDGTYHEQNILHFVAKEAGWKVPPVFVEQEGSVHATP